MRIQYWWDLIRRLRRSVGSVKGHIRLTNVHWGPDVQFVSIVWCLTTMSPLSQLDTNASSLRSVTSLCVNWNVKRSQVMNQSSKTLPYRKRDTGAVCSCNTVHTMFYCMLLLMSTYTCVDGVAVGRVYFPYV